MKVAIRKTLSKLRGSEKYRLLAEYERLQWQSEESLRAQQLEKVKALAQYAYDTVPYYKEVFDQVGLLPAAIVSFEDYARLPVLTKDILRSRLEELVSSSVNKDELIVNTSGGSTGDPVRFYQDRQLYEEMFANWMLCFSFAGWTPGDQIVSIWGNPSEFKKPPSSMALLKGWLSGTLTLNAFQYNREVMADWVKVLERYKRVYIYGYASALADFSEYLIEKGRPVTGVKAVMTSAEKLHAQQRKIIGDAFGCHVFDQYGSREVPCISTECEHGNMHLLTHSAYIEFEADAEMGTQKVIATSLTNRGMPFLRYEIGDYASPKEGACACGRGFPLMEMDIGRSHDCLITPEGDVVYGAFFVRQVCDIKGISSFQFHQSQSGSVELRIVCNQEFSGDSADQVEQVERTIQDRLGTAMGLEILYVDGIPKTRGGKHRFVICDLEK